MNDIYSSKDDGEAGSFKITSTRLFGHIQREFVGDLWLIDSGHSQTGCTVCGKDTPCISPLFFYFFIALVWLNVEELGGRSPGTIALQPLQQQ